MTDTPTPPTNYIPLRGGWTRHGHPVPGVMQYLPYRPERVARCGGAKICQQCSHDALEIQSHQAATLSLKVGTQQNNDPTPAQYDPPNLGAALSLDQLIERLITARNHIGHGLVKVGFYPNPQSPVVTSQPRGLGRMRANSYADGPEVTWAIAIEEAPY